MVDRKMSLIYIFLVTCFIFILFFAKSIEMILVGDLLITMPLGALNALARQCPFRLFSTAR